MDEATLKEHSNLYAHFRPRRSPRERVAATKQLRTFMAHIMFKVWKFYAPQTKIFDGGTKRSMSLFESPFNAERWFCGQSDWPHWVGIGWDQVILGISDINRLEWWGCYFTNSMATKRRFWSVENALSRYLVSSFIAFSPNRVAGSMKGAYKMSCCSPNEWFSTFQNLRLESIISTCFGDILMVKMAEMAEETHASQTKILERVTNDEMRVFEALFRWCEYSIFEALFRWCEYSIWATNHWKVNRKSASHLLFRLPKSSFGDHKT